MFDQWMYGLICCGLPLLFVAGVAGWLRTPNGRRVFRDLQQQYRADQRKKGRSG